MPDKFYVIANRELPDWVATKPRTYYYPPEDLYATYKEASDLLKDNPDAFGQGAIVFEVKPAVIIHD